MNYHYNQHRAVQTQLNRKQTSIQKTNKKDEGCGLRDDLRCRRSPPLRRAYRGQNFLLCFPIETLPHPISSHALSFSRKGNSRVGYQRSKRLTAELQRSQISPQHKRRVCMTKTYPSLGRRPGIGCSDPRWLSEPSCGLWSTAHSSKEAGNADSRCCDRRDDDEEGQAGEQVDEGEPLYFDLLQD